MSTPAQKAASYNSPAPPGQPVPQALAKHLSLLKRLQSGPGPFVDPLRVPLPPVLRRVGLGLREGL
eukprot:9626209-Prorocentrum_lima.AAC.1